MQSPARAWWLAGVLCAGCAGTPAPTTTEGDGATTAPERTTEPETAAPVRATLPEPPDDPARAPFPFTRAQIRDATPDGRTYVFALSMGDAAPVHIQLRFLAVSDEGCTMESRTMSPEGDALGQPRTSQTTWAELQSHATYPVDGTTIADATITVGAGTFACRVYTRTEVTDEGTRVERAWFANDLPGAPVRHRVMVDDTVVATMELLAHTR